MKEAADRFTLPLEGVDKPRRGRPPKPDALTPAQRAKAYRQRLKADPVKRWKAMIAKTEKLRDEAWPLVLAQHQAKQAEARRR